MKRVQQDVHCLHPTKIQHAIDQETSSGTTSSAGTSFDNQIDLEKLHFNSHWSDVKFLFDSGDGTASEYIPANKVVLAAQSDVFAAMFYGELKEKGDITVRDASIGDFKKFLQFFYLNRVQLSVENVVEVMGLGNKYNVTKCVDTCAEFLMGIISAEKACVTLSIAKLYEHQNLLEFCEKYIVTNSESVLKSKSFLECDKRLLAHLLKMDSLTCSETIVFEACMEWIKAKSKQNEVTKQLIQKHLGELFYDLRFTSMKLEEFDALSRAHEYAFTFAEYKDIVHTFAAPKASPTLFNKNPRRRHWNDEAIIACNRKTAESHLNWWFYLQNNKPTQFESTKPLLLGTLVFAPITVLRDSGFVDLDSDFPIDVTIVELSKQNESTIKSTRAVSNFKINLPSRRETSIKLPDPVHVKPSFYYEIQLKPLQCTDQHCYECGSLVDEVKIENDVVIKFHGDFCYRSKLANSITGLGFNRI